MVRRVTLEIVIEKVLGIIAEFARLVMFTFRRYLDYVRTYSHRQRVRCHMSDLSSMEKLINHTSKSCPNGIYCLDFFE